ncbi:MAG: glycosyltransferase family 2 protein [Clostridia bacterium]|nr:glycosyltransferase family 2 protein [Clostridia bacterium]
MIDISVIIPAYNVEKYLPRALDSLLRQKSACYEVILVDDGSTDGTPRICDEYAALDSRIKVIHQKNSGAPAARNAAIDIAKGKYLFFMDGDDWAEPEMLMEMHAAAEKYSAEMVVAGFFIDTCYGTEDVWSQKISIPDAFYDNAGDFRIASVNMFDHNLLYVPWNKLVLAERMNRLNIRFRNTKMDDFPFNLDYVRDIELVAVMGNAYYHFMRERAESETARYNPALAAKREEEHAWITELFEYWGMGNDPVAREMIARRYIERIFGVIENITCKASPLTAREKCAAISKVIAAPDVKKQLPVMKPRSLMMKLMLIPLKLRSAFLAYALGCVMSLVKRRFSGIFARLKAGR